VLLCVVLPLLLLAVFTKAGGGTTEDLELRVIEMSGIILHKTAGPLESGPVDNDDFPGQLPAQFIVHRSENSA
jgi:hypothetical protein